MLACIEIIFKSSYINFLFKSPVMVNYGFCFLETSIYLPSASYSVETRCGYFSRKISGQLKLVWPDALTSASFRAHLDATYYNRGLPSSLALYSSISNSLNIPVRNLFFMQSLPLKNLSILITSWISIPVPKTLGILIILDIFN